MVLTNYLPQFNNILAFIIQQVQNMFATNGIFIIHGGKILQARENRAIKLFKMIKLHCNILK